MGGDITHYAENAQFYGYFSIHQATVSLLSQCPTEIGRELEVNWPRLTAMPVSRRGVAGAHAGPPSRKQALTWARRFAVARLYQRRQGAQDPYFQPQLMERPKPLPPLGACAKPAMPASPPQRNGLAWAAAEHNRPPAARGLRAAPGERPGATGAGYALRPGTVVPGSRGPGAAAGGTSVRR